MDQPNLYDEEEEDDDFLEFAALIAFPRRPQIYRQRPDHFTMWRENEFFDRFRMSKNTVRFILHLIEDRIRSPTDWNFAVTPEQKLLLTLRYYATGSMLSACGDFIGIHKATASRIVKLVSHTIACLRPQFIHFPDNDEDKGTLRQRFYDIAGFPGVIGAIDCTHVKIRSPGGHNAEIYRNRKGFFSINVQTICDADLQIQDVVARWPGSSHDSTIFNNSQIRAKFERGEMGQNNILLGDGGYAVRNYLLTPFRNPGTPAEVKYNDSLTRTRNTVERSYGVWKRRYPILATGINVKVASSQSIIVATAVLHNIACQFGERTPRVTREIETQIRATAFNNNMQEQVGPANERHVRRNAVVRYFEGVLQH